MGRNLNQSRYSSPTFMQREGSLHFLKVLPLDSILSQINPVIFFHVISLSLILNTVARKPVAGQRPREKKIYKIRCWVTFSHTNMFQRQRLNYNNNENRYFLRGLYQGVIIGTNLELSHLWDIRQQVRTLGENIVRIRYQETTSEDIEDIICAAVTAIVRACKPVRLL
jgi:hypothetical protein